MDGSEDVGLSRTRSIRQVTTSVASVPALAGYVSLGAAVLLGRSLGQALRAASRALDRAAANAVQARATYGTVRRVTGIQRDAPGVRGGVGDWLGEAHIANDSQWIIWLDEGGAAEWAGVAVQFDWAGLMEMAPGADEERNAETRGAPPPTLRRAAGGKKVERRAPRKDRHS